MKKSASYVRQRTERGAAEEHACPRKMRVVNSRRAAGSTTGFFAILNGESDYDEIQ